MDGLITVEELRNMYKRASTETAGRCAVPADSVLAAMIAEADLDGDGKLNFDEVGWGGLGGGGGVRVCALCSPPSSSISRQFSHVVAQCS